MSAPDPQWVAGEPEFGEGEELDALCGGLGDEAEGFGEGEGEGVVDWGGLDGGGAEDAVWSGGKVGHGSLGLMGANDLRWHRG